MAEIGKYNTLKVIKKVDFGMYLDGGEGEEILLPKRFVPRGIHEGDDLEVFLYHDSENRIIATTQKPKGILGDIVMLEAVEVTKQGAFLDWGLMKDLFMPLSQQESKLIKGERYLVMIYKDEQTGRLAATERISRFLSNDHIDLEEMQPVDLVVQRESDIGYVVIINNKYTGLLHYNEVFRGLDVGDKEHGFVKKIREDNKIDVSLGEPGYKRVTNETDVVLDKLRQNDGYLPFHDKSDAEDIYNEFGMSKRTFKMIIGALYRQRKIELTKTGIKLIEEA